jgi:NAD(P)H-quinone oxidoreductase subunit 5
VWSIYRVADACFLIAALALHHTTGQGEFSGLMGTGPWPAGEATMSSVQALFVGSLLLVAAAGKSALIPFCGWLPRAMEGPTPSSAVFYGALSVHLGAFLLLRVSPILELSPALCAAVVALGIATAIFASVAGRVQTDIKTALAFASMTQLGIIVAEIGVIFGFGFRGLWGLPWEYLPLVHIIGHASLRTLQFLRAPSILYDYHNLENAIGAHLEHRPSVWARFLSGPTRIWLYRFALERGYLDSLLNRAFVFPFSRVFRWCDAAERRWTDLLAGGRSRESDDVAATPETIEEHA